MTKDELNNIHEVRGYLNAAFNANTLLYDTDKVMHAHRILKAMDLTSAVEDDDETGENS